MGRRSILPLGCLFLALGVMAQQVPSTDASNSSTTVRGCLNSNRGNYIVVEDSTGLVYALRGVGDKLNRQVGHEVEVTGQLHPGQMKTGVRSTKTGSNPSDTVHGVEGVPLQVADVTKDVRTVAKHCKAADQQ
jgi:hypothetical protein